MLTIPTPQDLRSQRTQLGLTQAQVADAAGVSQSLIARIELGDVDPSYSTLRSVIHALNDAERKTVSLGEIMVTDLVTVGPDEQVRGAVDRMREHGFSQLPVIQDGVPVGSVTEDALVHELTGGDPDKVGASTVRDVMAPPFPALAPGEPVQIAMRMLEDRAAVLVMEGGKVTGMVTRTDLLGTLGS